MGEKVIKYSASDLVAQRVNHLRFLNGMTQRKLGLLLGASPGTMSNKMSGASRWNVDEIVELAEFFGVSADYLLGREPIESAVRVNAKIPASSETGISAFVAGTGFEPATSGL